MTISIKKVKDILSTALTALMIVVLFGAIFVATKLVELTWNYVFECFIVIVIAVEIKLLWYPFGEEKRLAEGDLQKKKDDYYKYADENITDIYDFEAFLVLLNQENRENYVKNKMGCRNQRNTKPEKYNKLYFKYMRKADKLRQIKASDIIELTDCKMLADSKNYLKQKKVIYQIFTTAISAVTMIGLATMAVDSIMLNWANVFRYLTYIVTIGTTLVTTVYTAYKTTGTETLDHLARCSYIVTKYKNWKEGGKRNDHTV